MTSTIRINGTLYNKEWVDSINADNAVKEFLNYKLTGWDDDTIDDILGCHLDAITLDKLLFILGLFFQRVQINAQR